MTIETPEQELFRLTVENQASNSRIAKLLTIGVKIVPQEIEEIEVE